MTGRPARVQCLFALGLAILCFSVVTRTLPLAFFSESRALPRGIRGDQGFYLWALERALHSDSYGAFIHNCSWSERFCFDLRAVPQEWNNLFTVGTIARLMHQDSIHAIFGWYYVGLLLNVVAATVFIRAVGGNWSMAGPLGCAVGLHESALARILGHFSLVAVWPMIFSLTLFWKTLEGVFSGRRAWLLSLVSGCVSLFLTVWTSFYYAVFGVVLFVAAAFCFFMTRRSRSSRAQGLGPETSPGTARRLVVCAVCAMVTLALAMYPVRHVILGLGVEKHAPSYVRSEDDVRQYSAHWGDYIRPSPVSASFHWLSRFGIDVPVPDPGVSGEVHSFLGVTFLVFLFWALCVAFQQWRTARGSPGTLSPALGGAQRECLIFLAAFLFVAFFSTAPGGLLIHRMFPAMRCFGRMAPFAALFGAVLIGRAFRDTARRPYLLALMFVLGFTVEESNHGRVDGRTFIGTAVIDSFVQKLGEECKSRGIHISPETEDYMDGPYSVFFLAERAGCRLSGIDGPGRYMNPAPVQTQAGSMILRWERGRPMTVDLGNGALLVLRR